MEAPAILTTPGLGEDPDSAYAEKRIAIAANAAAGKGRAIAVVRQLEVILSGWKIVYRVFWLPWPEDFGGYTAIWLVGGDGTLNHFVNAYPGITIPLALFKGGSGNDFAWKLYGNLKVHQYAAFALQNRPRRVDAGQCNGRYFMNGVGIGFDGQVAKAAGHKRYISTGFIAYLLVVLRTILGYREETMRIEAGHFREEGTFFMLTVANGSRYGGGFMVAPAAQINDGLLDIVAIDRIPVMRRLLRLPVVKKGKHLGKSYVRWFRTGFLSVSGNCPLAAHLDGELTEASRFDISVQPGKFLFYYPGRRQQKSPA